MIIAICDICGIQKDKNFIYRRQGVDYCDKCLFQLQKKCTHNFYHNRIETDKAGCTEDGYKCELCGYRISENNYGKTKKKKNKEYLRIKEMVDRKEKIEHLLQMLFKQENIE